MSMRAENLRKLADVADDNPSSRSNEARDRSSFIVNGHPLIAIRDLDNDGRGGASANAHFRVPVGHMMCAGTRYLIYDADGGPAASTGLPASPAETLTRRELQIAFLISEGKLDKEIARQLGISGYTVREHIRRIFAKLNIGRRSAIASCVLAGRPEYRQDYRL
ncbi:LuxR family transcriptional regulator [Mesorhizobium tamadayense]|uniref:LuxR family transcriptional regulator n=1 Tax=Mesorhizobium tamadayense TaxID=425306 RepID=A0A3P3G815_9HYPH|nr:helix-turn-helix transcriptional regulator [Mesorhizobium tamadayense]RRI06433.1 LuxR family transcriptional regulator [Mesorhizobium tamadayense]